MEDEYEAPKVSPVERAALNSSKVAGTPPMVKLSPDLKVNVLPAASNWFAVLFTAVMAVPFATL